MDVLSKLSFQDLSEFLDEKAAFYEKPAFIQDDPIQLAHRFNQKEDIEIVAFLVPFTKFTKLEVLKTPLHTPLH
jgi:hypothetical protein